MIKFFISLLLMASSCTSQPVLFVPEAFIPSKFLDEKALYKELKNLRPQELLKTAEQHPHFFSVRVRLLVLEALIDVGFWEEAKDKGLELEKIPMKQKNIRKKRKKNIPKKAYITESQKHKVYFALAQAYGALNNIEKTLEYFEKTRKRPNYYYLYRYARFLQGTGDTEGALLLFAESFERGGHFAYIAEAYAQQLLNKALKQRYQNPEETQKLLAFILDDEKLSKTPVVARAEILSKQKISSFSRLFRIEG